MSDSKCFHTLEESIKLVIPQPPPSVRTTRGKKTISCTRRTISPGSTQRGWRFSAHAVVSAIKAQNVCKFAQNNKPYISRGSVCCGDTYRQPQLASCRIAVSREVCGCSTFRSTYGQRCKFASSVCHFLIKILWRIRRRYVGFGDSCYRWWWWATVIMTCWFSLFVGCNTCVYVRSKLVPGNCCIRDDCWGAIATIA